MSSVSRQESTRFGPNALHQRIGRYGLQTMCEGGGMANATIIERPPVCSSSGPDCALKCDFGNVGMALPSSGAESAYPDQYERCRGGGGIYRDDVVARSQRGGRTEFSGLAKLRGSRVRR